MCAFLLWYLLSMLSSIFSSISLYSVSDVCMSIVLYSSFLGFPSPGLPPFVFSLLLLFQFLVLGPLYSFPVCLIVPPHHPCISLRDLFVHSLRTSTCLIVFCCITLRELSISFLKTSVIFMRWDLRSQPCCSSGVLRYPWLAVVEELGFLMVPCCIGFC